MAPRDVRRAGGWRYGGIERLGPERAMGAPAGPRTPHWLSSRWGRSQWRLHPGSTSAMLQQLLRPPGCSEELPSPAWLCLPLEHEVLPLPGPTPCSQPASPPAEGRAQRRCCPSHPSRLVLLNTWALRKCQLLVPMGLLRLFTSNLLLVMWKKLEQRPSSPASRL